MKKYLFYYSTLIVFIILTSCGSNKNHVRIGTQTWTRENLNVTTFSNGDPIPEARTVDEWRKAYDEKKPVWCYYNFDPSYEKRYGKLYNIFAVKDVRKLAPNGWHIPTNEEWMILINYLGGDTVAGKKMKSKEGWLMYENREGNGNNSSEFNAKPGGIFSYTLWFKWDGEYGTWWSSTESETPDGCSMRLDFHDDEVDVSCGLNLGSAYSVRCIKD